MQLGEYSLDEALGVGPTGAIFLAHDPKKSPFEVRFLDQAHADPEHWQALTRRLRLLDLVQHSNLLRPVVVDLAHETPYLIVPKLPVWKGVLSEGLREKVASQLVELLASVHRAGLTLGGHGELELWQVSPAHFVLDLTETKGSRIQKNLDATVDDVSRMGDLLSQLLGVADLGGTQDSTLREVWIQLITGMRQSELESRPLAAEILAQMQRFDVQQTIDSSLIIASNLLDAPQTSRTPEVGDTLGRFKLEAKLGEGAIGFVFRGVDISDGQQVAIKVLKPHAIASDKSRRRFIKEGRLLAAIDTPFVTRLLEVNHDKGTPYIALEFVDGTNLADELRKGEGLPEERAIAYILDAARGLASAHSLGMIHRDIKPANLLLTKEGRVKVTDFGMAREVDQSESMAMTQDGATMGTPLYMAPEQFSSNQLDPRADVYSLGATLFHLLTGRTPFQATRLPLLAKAVINDPAPALGTIKPEISGPIAEFVAKTLSKSPDNRPTDAGDFLDQLERIIKGEQTHNADHPFDPKDAGTVKVYSFVWQLKSTPAQLWPHVSNTERLNKTIGMPSPTYKLTPQVGGGTKRVANARAIGMKMQWEEHPFEWIEGKRMGILRQFHKGPFAWFLSTVELTPNETGGTTLRHTLRVESRGLLGKIITPIQMGIISKKALGKVYSNIDDAVKSNQPQIDPFEGKTQIPAHRRRLLGQRIEQLVNNGATSKGAQLLQEYLVHASDQEVSRIRPLSVAEKYDADENVMIDTCLRAVGGGLLRLQWDVICPLCRVPSGRKNTLKELKDHEDCPTCDKSFAIDFASAVELVFEVHPEIRKAEKGLYCAGGPVHSPHVVAQTRLAPSERIELQLILSEGNYRLRGPQLPWSAELRVVAGAGVRRLEIDLGQKQPEPIPPLGVGGQKLILENTRSHEVVVRIERTAARNDALTAARALSLPAFRELFPGELLSPGQLTPASSITLALIEITGIDPILEKQGDAQAYETVRKGFEQITKAVKKEGGTVVKSVGDGLLVSFTELVAAVRAVLSLGKPSEEEGTPQRVFRAGLHRGFVMVTTVDDRLDYFGTTTKIVAKLASHANPGELLMSTTCAGDSEVSPILQNRLMRIVEVPQTEKPLLACKVGISG